MENIHQSLNPQQLDVVLNADGACLVLAGAGSGKTKTIVHRVAHLIRNGIDPSEILLLTFTNKAAKEMMARCELLLGGKSKGLWGGTFHHIAHRMLRTGAGRVGFTSSFTILDQEDRKRALKQAVKQFGEPPELTMKPEVIGSLLSYSANTLIPIGEVVKERFSRVVNLPQWMMEFQTFFQRRKRELNAMDFDDMLTYWLKLLKEHANTKEFMYLLVDEYQDINRVQDAIVEELSQKTGNILVVGDDAQSIYGFRGADVDHIRNFPQRFRAAKIFPLTINYRSTPEILNLANASLMSHAAAFKKELTAQRSTGSAPELIEPLTMDDEAQEIIRRIRKHERAGIPLTEQAILFRATSSSLVLELQLQREGIPYVLRGGLRFFEQAHIKDCIAAAKVVALWHDELAWTRLAELLPGVGPANAAKIWGVMKGVKREELEQLFHQFPQLQQTLQPILPLLQITSGSALADYLGNWVNTWYRKYLEDNYDDGQDRYDDCMAFCAFVANYNSPDQLFADMALSEQFQKGSAVTEQKPHLVCSTIHQAKGLEWQVVYLIGLTDGALPHYRSLEKLEDLEEERRLLYVAITRAKDRLVLSSARESQGGNYAIPSRFLDSLRPVLQTQELDDDGLPVINLDGEPVGILDKILLLKKGERYP